MSDTRIITNNRPRFTVDWRDLTPGERADFDYLDSDEKRDCATFIRYRGATYDLGEFMRAPASLAPWDGYHADSFFSAVLARYPEHDTESVIMGLALS